MTTKEIAEKLGSMRANEEWKLNRIQIIKNTFGGWTYFYSTEMHCTNNVTNLARLVRKIQKAQGEQ